MNVELLTDLIITKVYSATTVRTPANKSSGRVDRQRWALVIKYEGKTTYFSNGKSFLSDANHIMVLPKGCSYEWQSHEAGYICSIEFECEQTYTEPFNFYVKNSEKTLRAFKALQYKRNIKKALFEMESIRDVYSILLALARSETEKYFPTEKYNKIAPAIEYVSVNYDKTITNDLLAGVSGMSTVYFRKLFSEIMGVSPVAYAQRFRIEKAKEMLKTDFGTISDVAASLGYTSLYDFSRAFKKQVGVSPSNYLKRQ